MHFQLNAVSTENACEWDDPKEMNVCEDVFCEGPPIYGTCWGVFEECLCQLHDRGSSH